MEDKRGIVRNAYRWPRWSLFVSLAGLLFVAASAVRERHRAAEFNQPAPTGPRQLFLAVDGLSFETFTEAQSRGLFSRFKHAARMIAPYPSMSHPSWTAIIGSERAFGVRGRLSTVEARWFDLNEMRVADDPRQVIARQASPFNYMRVFDTFFDPLIEPLMYFPGHRLFDRELQETERDILDGFHGHRYNAYVSGTDAMAHTHKGELYGFLTQLDAMIERVVTTLETRDGPVEVWMVSDHGNAGAFAEGREESYLTPVSLSPAIKRAGLVQQDTGTVTDSSHVAVVTIALASMVNLYFPDLSRRHVFATEALREPGVALVTWLEVGDHTQYVVVRDAIGGDAAILWRRTAVDSTLEYAYTATQGNPLGLPTQMISSRESPKWFADSTARRATEAGPYPDALNRLVASAEKQVENAPDLIVSLRDGYAYDGEFGRVVRMVRTHGSLSARATLGVVASTATTLTSSLRASEVASAMRVEPRELFAQSAWLTATDGLALARQVMRSSKLVATGHADQSIGAAFLRRARPVVQSMGYFTWNRLRDLRQLAPSSTDDGTNGSSITKATSPFDASNLSATFKQLGKVDLLGGLSHGVDTLLALADSLSMDSIDSRLRVAADRVRGIPELAPLATLHDDWQRSRSGKSAKSAVGSGATMRSAAMVAWTFPYFLDAALDIPERDSVPDTRDRTFAVAWQRSQRNRVQQHPERLFGTSQTGATLFAQVFAERSLWQRVEPAAIPLLYNPNLHDVTVVLVPGIYGELFDGELWQRGMQAVRERLGVRAFTAKVDGRCSSAYNATALLNTLRTDTRHRLERGYHQPRYLLIGYSKGGIDATEAVLADSAFATQQVAALVTVATPHLGSPVAERAELPSALLEWASREPIPAACIADGSAASLYPATRRAFWSDQAKPLANRTRLLSLAFASDVHDAHPWMKLTKQIGQFTGLNDGVVAVSAAHFPLSVPSVNLGTVAADHIAGIAASRFPQEAFLEAVVITAGELGALSPETRGAWRSAQQRWMSPENQALTAPAMAVPFTSSLRIRAALPGGSTDWKASTTFRLLEADELHKSPGAQRVRAMTTADLPNGFVMQCDQKDLNEFRREYEFLYDAGNGGHEGDLEDGFSIVADRGSHTGRACRLSTRKSAIKMTTVSVRFSPAEFPALSVHLRVLDNVTGVDPSTRKRGANDAAFKLWFVVRDTRPQFANASRLFGYTWTAVDRDNVRSPDGDLREAVSSKRSVVVKTLPEAWLVTVGDATVGHEWQSITRDLASDLRRAYPTVPVDAFEVVGITIQSDSDESRGRSTVLLDEIAFRRGVAQSKR